MATRIVRTCDRHGEKGDENVEAEVTTVGLAGEWYALDVCPECDGDLLDAVREAVQKWGLKVDPQNPGKPGKPKGKNAMLSASGGNLNRLLNGGRMGKTPTQPRALRCFWCPLDYANEGALTRHAHVEHGLAERSMVAMHGRQCPLCGADGYDMLSAHTKRDHGTKANGAFVQAAALGDPYGVVAKQLALAPWHPGGLEIAAVGASTSSATP